MSDVPTKARKDASAWTLDDDLKPLAPMQADDAPVPKWWRAVELHLDEEPMYTTEELQALGVIKNK